MQTGQEVPTPKRQPGIGWLFVLLVAFGLPLVTLKYAGPSRK